MRTYYHVTTDNYNDGEDLLCWTSYVEKYGEAPGEWKWDEAEEGFDNDVVCLFRELSDAQAFSVEFLGGNGVILAINDTELRVIRNEEGFDCVVGRIPAINIIGRES